MEKSVVIIGGGLGGLFTGAILAREGVGVTVLEKNTNAGGGLQSFTRFGETFDTGMHVITGMKEGGNVYRICKYLGILDKVHVEHIGTDVVDRIFFAEDGRTYDMMQGRERFIDSLAKDFPEQRQNLERYVEAMYRIVDEVDMFYLRPSSSANLVHSDEFMMAASDFIDSYITDKRLSSILAYMNTLYGGGRGITPAYIHAIVSVLSINGPSRFAGGSQLFADTLRDSIVSNGGRVITGDEVTRVCTKDKVIDCVVTSKGHSYTADHYICAIHPCTFIRLLDDPKALPKAFRDRLEELPNTYSAFILNIRLKPGKFRYIGHMSYYMSRYADMWNFGSETGEWPVGFLFTTPPEIGQGEYSTKMIIASPMSWNTVRRWENTTVGRRGSEYEDWKCRCTDLLLDRMERLYPDFRDCIENINSASPLTIRDYYGVKDGSMYGFAKDCRNILLTHIPVATKISNLLLTGQNINLHGFCGVPLTAINTSEAILGNNYVLNRINEAN